MINISKKYLEYILSQDRVTSIITELREEHRESIAFPCTCIPVLWCVIHINR